MKNTWKLNLAQAILFILLFNAVSCKKDNNNTGTPLPPGYTRPLLREITVQNLPSPYFRFEYNPDSTTKQISFASALSIWEVGYGVNGKINMLTNLKQPSTLSYFYTGPNVTRIRTDNTLSGKTEWTNHFEYDNWKRLTKITTYKFESNGTDSVKFRETKFAYHKDHNLSGYEQSRRRDDGTFELTTATYTNYDLGNNVDDFVIYKEFFEDFLYLPDVKIQLNNPRSLYLKTGANEYSVEYAYQYNNDIPARKRTKITQTKGSQAGTTTESLTQYFYY